MNELNLGLVDGIILLESPIYAIIGRFANWAILEVNLSEKPITNKNGKIQVRLRNHLEVGFILKWLSLRLMVGGILGLVFALYFVEIINDDFNSISIILGFAILIGYAAPKTWVSQEKMVQKYIDQKVKENFETTTEEKKE